MREREECDSGCSGSPSIRQALCYNPHPEGGTMDIVSQLKEERAKIAGQLNALDTAITALSGLDRRGGSRGPRRMSASARAKISAESALGKNKGPQGCPDQSRQATYFSSGISEYQSGN